MMADANEPRSSIPLRVRLFCGFVKLASYLTLRTDGTVKRRLADWLEQMVPANETPSHGVYSKDVVIDRNTGVWVRLFIPVAEDGKDAADEKLPVVIYFHGGGFCCLSADGVGYDIFCRRMARRLRAVVVSVNYRLAPEHKWPTAYEDSYSAVAWVGSQEAVNYWKGSTVNVDLGRCYLMGDSAGANIVHHVGCRVANQKAEKGNCVGVQIAGHILVQPYFGGEQRTASELKMPDPPLLSMHNSDWFWRAFLPRGATRDHPAANVFGPGDRTPYSALSLPPSLVVVGGFDILQDWQLQYCENLRKHNYDARLLFYENAIHGFHMCPDRTLKSILFRDVRHFMEWTHSASQISVT